VTYQSEDVGDGPAAEDVSEASCGDEDPQEKVNGEEDGDDDLEVLDDRQLVDRLVVGSDDIPGNRKGREARVEARVEGGGRLRGGEV
jgi:hypothetical protein